MKLRLVFLYVLLLTVISAAAPEAPASEKTAMHLRLRTQIQPYPGSTSWTEANFDEAVPAAKTAIIITDMWDKHWCGGATRRVEQIAKRMEPVLSKARAAGVLIIHAPSDTMAYYANTRGRQLALDAPFVAPPTGRRIARPALPIDDSDGGCDTPGDTAQRAWTRENPALSISPEDVISDQGREIYNVLRERGIDTVFSWVSMRICASSIAHSGCVSYQNGESGVSWFAI